MIMLGIRKIDCSVSSIFVVGVRIHISSYKNPGALKVTGPINSHVESKMWAIISLFYGLEIVS